MEHDNITHYQFYSVVIKLKVTVIFLLTFAVARSTFRLLNVDVYFQELLNSILFEVEYSFVSWSQKNEAWKRERKTCSDRKC